MGWGPQEVAVAERCCAESPDGAQCDGVAVVNDPARGLRLLRARPTWTAAASRHRGDDPQGVAAPDRYLAALAEETDEHLAIQLGCPPRLVWRLRLAGWPRADQWAADVDGIAASMDAE